MKHDPIFRTLFAAFLLVLTACGGSGSIDIRHINNSQTALTFRADSRYLLLPVEDGIPNAVVTVSADGIPDRTFRAALAQTRTDYKVPFDLTPYQGMTVTVEITNSAYDAVCWEQITLSDRFRPAEEPRYRPLYHHTPAYGWMNDPNGMVWYDGEYHLFFQHNPYGSRWENMTWGHSVSRDLLHWEQLPNVLEPDSLGAMFSGSCVIDRDNTAGFGHDAMIALYTAAGSRQTQCLAYSNDRGRTFTKYAGNPVLTGSEPDFRDPKVFWHEPTARWIMVLAVGRNMEFYSSEDLKTWRFESRFGEGHGSHANVWECPDLFELPVDGDPARKKWVLLCSLGTESGSRVQYFVGNFDGRTFTNDAAPEQVKWMDAGRDHYAAVTWSNAPGNRRIAIGWMSNWQYANEVPTLVFRNANTLPRELGLRTCGNDILLTSAPCREVRTLLGDRKQEGPVVVSAEYNTTGFPARNDGAYCIELAIGDISAEVFGFKLFNCNGEFVDCCFNRLDGTLTVDRAQSGTTAFSPAFAATPPARLPAADSYRITLYADPGSLELFVNDGETVVTNLVFPSEPYNRMNIYAKGGKISVQNLDFYKVTLK